MTRRQRTPWFRPRSTASQFSATVLCAIDARYVPVSLRDLEAWKIPALWNDAPGYAVAYDALCKQGEALLMDIGERLQMEIRALRGVDDLAPGYNDPEADPFTLSLGTVEDVKRQLETANTTLDAIRVAVESMANAETLEDIKASAAQIALLLA